jgi:histidinol-phosphatase (PHP family)
MADQVRGAIAAGLDELGISDHYTLVPGHEVPWSLAQTGLPDYFRALHAARRLAGEELVLRFGIEADYIPESVAELGEILQAYPLDYVIGSVHFIDGFPVDDSASHWEAISQDERNVKIRKYWARVTDMASSGVFDIAGHLDLYKKFGHHATVDLSTDIAAALDAIAEAGMAVELNTSGLHYVGEAYPSPAILLECHSRGIPTLVTADAHIPQHLTRGYDVGIGELRKAGYTQQAVFEGRRMSLVDL